MKSWLNMSDLKILRNIKFVPLLKPVVLEELKIKPACMHEISFVKQQLRFVYVRDVEKRVVVLIEYAQPVVFLQRIG